MTDIQTAAERWHIEFAKAFITSVSTGEGEYFIKVKFPTMRDMHDAYDAMAALASLCIPPSKPKRIEQMNSDREPPDLLSDQERKDILSDAEELWRALESNDLGGFSGINRPFYILHAFKEVIEKYGHRDVGLNWSRNDLDNISKSKSDPSTPS